MLANSAELLPVRTTSAAVIFDALVCVTMRNTFINTTFVGVREQCLFCIEQCFRITTPFSCWAISAAMTLLPMHRVINTWEIKERLLQLISRLRSVRRGLYRLHAESTGRC